MYFQCTYRLKICSCNVFNYIIHIQFFLGFRCRQISEQYACHAIWILSSYSVCVLIDEDGEKEVEGAAGTEPTDLGLSSDEDAEKCPICLNSFHEQPVATPQNCEHYFCLDCILEWAKVTIGLWGRQSAGRLHIITLEVNF